MSNRLYLHIPFCRHKCPYCAFVSRQAHGNDISRYVELLLEEMRLASQEATSLQQLDSIYFGGGTPSLLHPGQVRRLLEQADRLFGICDQGEITLEANPGTVSHDLLAGFRTAGINRLSMGIQSFDEQMLAILGRIHSPADALEAFYAARAAGFGNIGLDLIHALPGQTPHMWLDDLQKAIALAPEHISVYGLTLEDGTPFADRYADEDSLPDEDTSADMFEMADNVLAAAGYEHYEIANYARPGFRARHNSGYWKRDNYLGIGTGAHSLMPGQDYGIRFSNTPDISEYTASITESRLPRRDITILTREDAMSEFMFLGLRMSDGVDLSAFRSEFGMGIDQIYARELNELSSQGLLLTTPFNIRLSSRGMLLSNQVFSRFV